MDANSYKEGESLDFAQIRDKDLKITTPRWENDGVGEISREETPEFIPTRSHELKGSFEIRRVVSLGGTDEFLPIPNEVPEKLQNSEMVNNRSSSTQNLEPMVKPNGCISQTRSDSEQQSQEFYDAKPGSHSNVDPRIYPARLDLSFQKYIPCPQRVLLSVLTNFSDKTAQGQSVSDHQPKWGQPSQNDIRRAKKLELRDKMQANSETVQRMRENYYNMTDS
jgi:hypothetical protein